MRRLICLVCLALATASCTDKSQPPAESTKTPPTQTGVKPAPDLPAPFALERAVRTQLNDTKRQARDRANQMNQVMGR